MQLTWTPTSDLLTTGHQGSRGGQAPVQIPDRSVSQYTDTSLNLANSATYRLEGYRAGATWTSPRQEVYVPACS